MLMSKLKSLPMKKPRRHYVVKKFVIFKIFEASTSWLNYGITTQGDNLVSIHEVSLILFDGMFSPLIIGICTTMLVGASIAKVLRDFMGIDFYFLRCFLKEHVPYFSMAYLHTIC